MKIVTKIALGLPLTVMCIPIYAETIQYQVPACISKDTLSEFGVYIVKGDNAGMMQLIETQQCTVLQGGDEVSVISRGFMTATIRYEGIKLYTDTEALGQ